MICRNCNASTRVEIRYSDYKGTEYKCQKCKSVWVELYNILKPEEPRNRICYHCKNLNVGNATRGYSEYTPGSPFYFYCDMSHWEFDTYEDNQGKLGHYLEMAKTCKDFEMSKYVNG